MAFKVLLGLLAAVAVTGGAVYYGADSGSTCGGTCPLTAVRPTADESTGCPSESMAASSCCGSKAKLTCCADAVEETTGSGDAVAALTGGVAFGK